MISLVSLSLANINLAIAQTGQTEAFIAMLSGGEEVPPADTAATGVASFTWDGEQSIKYYVNVSAMDRVTAAHIHNAAKGENGEIVVTLFKQKVRLVKYQVILPTELSQLLTWKGRCKGPLSAT